MKKSLLLFGLFSASLFSHACKSSAAADDLKTGNTTAQNQSVNSASIGNAAPQIEQSKATSQMVNFKGVSFNYNPQIFGAVKSEEVTEYALPDATYKPDGVEPQHRLFTFDLTTDFGEMYIAVYPIDDFPRMYAVNKSSVKALEKEVNGFKKVLKDKNFRIENQIPYLRFIDSTQVFQVKVKHFPFQNGKGILFLTFWDTQVELPSNRQLRYVFEGLSDDGKYYVLAEMPASVSFLPDDSSEEYEGYKINWNKLQDKVEMKRFAEVNKKIAARLEKLPQNQFKPELKYFEEIISSLKIEK